MRAYKMETNKGNIVIKYFTSYKEASEYVTSNNYKIITLLHIIK